ncbi:MAG: endonuclease/exonuclease/phosphatase family protein [Actinomycetota bacterium]
MSVRFASLNVENFFARPKALNLMTWEAGQDILSAYNEFNSLIQLADYTPAIKARMKQLLTDLDVYRENDAGIAHRVRASDPEWAWLRANHGTFDVDHEATGIEIVANNRSDWIGWLELATDIINETSVEILARVIDDLHADVQGVVEAESRPTLVRFNEERLLNPFDHVMLIDGNDSRGIDVGLMTTAQFDITSMRSNVDMPDPQAPGDPLFSRDCAMYQVTLPSNAMVWVLMNHFKSQMGGSGPKRLRQAQGVRQIIDDLMAAGDTNIVVMGDLNEGPAAQGQPAANLVPLYDQNSPLVEVYALQAFNPGSRPGTFQTCSLRNRLDYIFVSQPLAGLVVGGGIERHGLWGDPETRGRPKNWEIYGDIGSVHDSASDHAAIFVDITL